MGNRFLGGIEPGAMPWKNRYIGNPSSFRRRPVVLPCPDEGFSLWPSGVLARRVCGMDLQTTGMEFASEMVIKATLMGMRIAEVPTTLSPDGRSRPPHLRPTATAGGTCASCSFSAPTGSFSIRGWFSFAPDFLLGAKLLASPVYIQGVALSVDTLIYSVTMIEVGFQAILFALLSRAYAVQEGLFPKPSKTTLLTPYSSLSEESSSAAF